jgi:eukaryotic-like serine/threonine-protein kinase
MAIRDGEAQRDERLAQLLEDITQGQRQGRPPDWTALAREHADVADELRQLLNVAQIVDIVRSSDPEATVQQAIPPAVLPPCVPKTFGEYHLLEELGRGAMGVVYKAWQPSLQRFVALKMILRGEHASVADLARFRGEARSAGGLSHPNIVPVYEVGESEGQAYFSMQYVEGTTLAARLGRGPLPARDAARYVAAIARAVHHAHQHGILHRDLKPSNVLIDNHDQPLVTDFGLAKRVSTSGQTAGGLTGTGAIVGTPSYMPPEQAAGRQGTPQAASDIYSLGAILYELLTGRPPFQAASAVDVLLMVRSEEAVRPRLLNRGIDPDLEMICLRCLEKRPEHRYASAAALASDLEAFLQGNPVSARSSSIVYLVGRLFRETHHAAVLENWGVLWMWHSVMILLLCTITSVLYWAGVRSYLPYLSLWSIGLVTWGSFFWQWRRRGGPVTFVERQIAHAWAAGVIASIANFVIEVLLGLPVLTLSPVLAVFAGMVFLVKAGTLSGWFYYAAAASFLTAIPMALYADTGIGPLLFGVVTAICFFLPGLKYYRQRQARC